MPTQLFRSDQASEAGMPLHHLTTLDDPRLEVYRDLRSSAAGRGGELFVVESMWLVERLLASPIGVASVLTERRYVDAVLPRVPESVPVFELPRALLQELVGFPFHRGVLACGYRPANPDPIRLMDGASADEILAVCVDVHDRENLGGVLRSSAAFGVRGVLLDPRCADPSSRRVARTSMGANFRIPIVRSADLAADLQRLRREHGVRLVATVCDDTAIPLQRVDRCGRTALLFGSEGYGLDPDWIRRCDRTVTIPIGSEIDSLNVSVATGICLQHFAWLARQARVKG
jgi:tRNA G18 (ribose-2'-O)-methylase SpoU